MHPKKAYPESSLRLIDQVEYARKEGLDVTFDCIPYPHGGTRLVALLPQWTHDGGLATIYDVLRSKEGREKLRKEFSQGYRESWDHVWLTYFKHERNKIYEGRSVEEVAAMTGKPIMDAVCDLLLDENLQISFHSSGLDPELLPVFFTYQPMMVGSDAMLLGDYPPALAFGSFPTVISKFCRDDRRFSLAEAIRKMTSYPAQLLGLNYRGILRDNMKADLVIFDYDKIDAPATRDNPKQFCKGIDYVIVNGKIVVQQGKHTGVLPGRALKHG